MQYGLVDLLHSEHILLDLNASSVAEVLDRLAAAMEKTEYVLRAYGRDALVREDVFPTGLPTEPIPVAIPHADPEHVLRSGVGIAVLRQPVDFGLMGSDGSDKVAAKVVFLLAIKEREKQVEMIQQLIQVIQSGDLLEGIVDAEEPEGVLELIKSHI